MTQNRDVFFKSIEEYCNRFNIPIQYLVEIISNQKVLPMIRGKAVEFTVFNFLKGILSQKIWTVDKINLNPQPNSPDQDVLIIHNKSKSEIIVECKSAVRNSFRLSTKNRNFPHFKVKCHRSRSYMGKTTNDRYLETDFDIVVSNVSNSILQPGEAFEVNDDHQIITLLENHYSTTGNQQIFQAASNDWRFALSSDIAVEEVIPRTPYVSFVNDNNWNQLSDIETVLRRILKTRGITT